MLLKQVTVSGTVGKQVVPRTSACILKGLVLTPSGANATVKVRDGIQGASGEVVLFARATSAHGSVEFKFGDGMKFTRGLHVTVIGTNAEAYVYLN